METQTQLIKVGDLAETEVTLLPDAIALRDDLLEQAGEITAVTDALDAEEAANVLRSITKATKDVENARKAVKSPVLDLGKRIDGIAKEFSGNLDTEKNRISRLLGDYEAGERRKRQEAERVARQAEAERLMAADQAAREGDKSAMEDAAKDIAEIRSQSHSVAHRPEGTGVRETWCFELEDIEALYKAAPYLCKIEPDGTAIRAAIKKNQNIPGLRIWKEAKSYVR